jgi:acetamidase/formamidase
MPVLEFKPKVYHNAFGGHDPVLTIRPGDAVRTSTADAHGVDRDGREVARSGNPLTGPFYVEGAQPGDSIAVRLDKLRPNRAACWSHSAIAPNTVDPDHVRALPEPGYADWVIESLERQNAAGERVRLAGENRPRLELAFALAPMLGCIGVAPPEGQVISSLTSGRHGGNMDWRGTVEGVTFYFPVFAEGGLLYLGDGHACQGDGEIVGSGVEVSFDVEFRVDVIRGMRINWPRGEDRSFIFTMGNARPLEQALQHATTEMLIWLGEGYSTDAFEAGLLLGFAVVYEVGNVFDPAYTMVCKLPKEFVRKRSSPPV